MPSSYTSLLGLVLPVQGELQGTWGDTVNNELTSLVDSSVAGTTTLSTDADVTLTDTQGSANQARQIILNCTGSRSALRTITAPARSKAYVIINNTTGGFGVKIVGAGPTTGVTIDNGVNAVVAWNGSDFEVVSSTAISDLTGTLPVANGGTGATTLTGVVKGNGTSAFTAGNVSLTTEVTGTLPVANGGTNLTTFPALSLPVANTLDTLSALTAAASQSIRVNSGGTAWEAYTPISSSGDVTGPASSVSGNIATFNGTTGKIIQDGGKALPTGTIVGTTDTQTLTNKTLTDPAIIGTILEDVYTISDGAAFEVDPGNGSVQLITLGANRTPKATNFAAGEAITLMVDDGSAYTLTWTDSTWGGSGVVWLTDNGSAPTLSTTGYTAIVLWKVSTQVYGARVGTA